jgi:proteasome lid subunit RPN8/RPN11
VTDYRPVLARLSEAALADPHREACGFVVADRSGGLAVVPVRNVVGEVEGPPGLGSEPETAFLADPAAYLALSRRLRREGGRIAAVFHSHVGGVPGRLSAVDRELATIDGRPVLPGADQIVVAVESKTVSEIRSFRWDGKAFQEVPVAGAPGHGAIQGPS